MIITILINCKIKNLKKFCLFLFITISIYLIIFCLDSLINSNNITLLNTINCSTALVPVVWGSNLSSALGQTKKLSNLLASMVSLTRYQKSVLIGLMLSDSHFNFPTSKHLNCCLRFSQSLSKFEYFWFVYLIFQNIIIRIPYKETRITETTTYYTLSFYTRCLPCLTAFYSLFYQNRQKIISIELFDYLDAIALAHWICGDGQYKKSGLALCTDSFTLSDVVLLINILIIKFNLECTIQWDNRANGAKYPRIYIRANSMAKLQALVSPYMVPSMLYKIHL
jgi:hypothetical protein